MVHIGGIKRNLAIDVNRRDIDIFFSSVDSHTTFKPPLWVCMYMYIYIYIWKHSIISYNMLKYNINILQ